ncbi:MAG: hypothetical protein WBM63_12350 [Sedimenticolaceae bacterium]|jgi:seryl-tRNA synthetase
MMPHKKTATTSRAGSAILLSLLAFAPVVHSADESTGGGEMQMLKQQLHDLQMRVEQLEQKLQQGLTTAPAAPAEPVPGGWRKQANWALLSAGMSDHRVREILGVPQDETTVSKFEFWDYGDGKARLYMGRLKSWEIPSGIDGQ